MFDSKITALLAQLNFLKRSQPNTKVLVFSQFTKTIQLLQLQLKNAGFSYAVIEGNMTAIQRKRAVDKFTNGINTCNIYLYASYSSSSHIYYSFSVFVCIDDNCSVFLLSLRAAGAGLSLTIASHVFMMEPSMNPALS